MTNPEQATEAEQATMTFHLALTRIGVATIEDAIRLWAQVPPTRVAQTVAVWLGQAIHLVMTRRGMARDLAMAYYRLVRALRTGRTIADPRKPEPPYVTLDELRRQFAALAGTRVPQEETPPPAQQPEPTHQTDHTSTSGEQPDDEPDSLDDELDRILVEEIADLDREMERQEREAEDEARILLEQLGPANLERKLQGIDDQDPATEVDQARDDAHRAAGARQAATAERITINAARSTLWAAAQSDRRTVGYVRLSRTGTPCGWCAMLISRGAAYKNERSATYSDGDKYHDNCHCFAEPIFSHDQYADSDLTALNRQYESLWPQVTKGLSGKAAVSAWRRFIRTQQQAAAQEARHHHSVQEA